MPFGFDTTTEPQQDQENNADAGLINDPVKELQKLEHIVDSTFEKIIADIGDETDTLLNKITSIQLSDVAKLARSPKDNKAKDDNIDAQIKNKLSGLDSDLIEQLNGAFVPKERLDRYKAYDNLNNDLYIAARMLNVYMDNLFVKNPYTKQFMDIGVSEEVDENKSISDEDKEVLTDLGKTLLAYFEIQKRLKNDITPQQLKYGNFYVEIVNNADFDDINRNPESFRILTEGEQVTLSKIEGLSNKINGLQVEFDFSELDIYKEDIDLDPALKVNMSFKDKIKKLFENKEVDIQSQILYEEVVNQITANDAVDLIRELDLTRLREIALKYISPENVVMLRFNGTDYGCLVIEGNTNSSSDQISKSSGTETGESFDFTQAWANMASKGSASYNKNENAQSEALTTQLISNIFKKIRNNFEIKSNKDLVDSIDNENTKFAVENMIYEKYKKHSQIKIRYVPPSRITNFSNRVDKYSPYGTSIFDSIMLPGRLYLLGLLSAIISRLNRAAVVRKWIIEVGAQRNHSELVERFKRELRNRTITMADVVSTKDISNLISDYQDFVTVSQNGKRFVDMELQPMHDRSLPIQELEQLKQELISATGIPSVYLGENAVELRETLVQNNVMFASIIDSMQSNINESVEHLLDNIFQQLLKLNGLDSNTLMLSRFIKCTLVPPLLLVLQHLEGTVSSTTNLINQLTGVGVQTDPIWFLRKFIKIIDWDAVKAAGEKYAKETALNQMVSQGGSTSPGY